MSLCVIDDRTVGCGEVYPADGYNRIYVLNTETEDWSLGNTVLVKGLKYIWDMCYMKTSDGTSCLVISCPGSPSVQAVEIIGGRIRWKTGVDLMGVDCFPWSVCTDRDNTVYMTDPVNEKLYLLSAEDGAVIRSVSLRPYGIISPVCVREVEATFM